MTQERGLSPEDSGHETPEANQNQVEELRTEFERESAEAELDRATIDDIVIEHPNVSESAARRGLKKIKEREKKQKKT